MSNRRSRPREVPLPLATLLMGAATFLAFALMPSVIATEHLDLVGSGGNGGSGNASDPMDSGGFFDETPIGDWSLGLKIAVGVTAATVAAAIAFLGGTKFVNSQNVLENEARRSIFEFIQQNPGAHLRATASALELSTTNVLWHLRKLESANLVASRKFEGYKVFYPSEGGIESRRRAIGSAVLRNDNAQQILEFVLGQPSAHQRQIARILGVNHGTVRWHLRKLQEAGLVKAVKDESDATAYYVSHLGVNLLAESGSQKAKAERARAAHAASTPGTPAASRAALTGPDEDHS